MAAGLFRGIVVNLRAANPTPTWRSQWITSRREPLGQTRSAFNLRRQLGRRPSLGFGSSSSLQVALYPTGVYYFIDLVRAYLE
jgi:hypothetical protein